ncbi:MAG: hypothetical protein ACD_5C00125G0003 [uncultured bacterium]|nr:MAG: hypothetical protein ACD_5C00125G0003 [uncultured bacterium]
MVCNFLYRIGLILLLIYPLSSYTASIQGTLTLSESEQLAINNSPELHQIEANAHALEEEAVAKGQFSDPQLIVGAANVPTNSFSFTQDDMTMINVGLQQAFPRGRSLTAKSKQTKALAKGQQRKWQEQEAMLLRNVRETWLDLYYWIGARKVIHENRFLYKQLLKAAESQYSANKGNQSDVLQVQVELSRLNDQIAQIEQRIDVLRAQLGRWIGMDNASRSLPHILPHWPKPLPFDLMKSKLQQHPLLKVDDANIEASRAEVAYAKEQYKPGWMLDVGYSVRQGRMANGQSRSNFVGAQATVDLPIFPGNRQNRELEASFLRLEAAQLDQAAHYKDLLKELDSQYAIWRSLSKRVNLYRSQLIPEAKQNAKAATLAYQNAAIDLTTVLRAYSNELVIRLERLQIQVERTKTRAALLYLEGIT